MVAGCERKVQNREQNSYVNGLCNLPSNESTTHQLAQLFQIRTQHSFFKEKYILSVFGYKRTNSYYDFKFDRNSASN